MKTQNNPINKGHVKVPVIMQMEALECGAASLSMILAYYNKWIPLEQVRIDCGVSRDGANAYNILTAAKSYGLETKAFRYELASLRENGTFPCIIHWNFNHFVVLCGFGKKHVYINDPGRGNLKISIEEFDRSFTGICLMFEPNKNFEESGKQQSILRYVWHRLRGTAAAIVFVMLTTLVSSIINVINPTFSRIFMDRILSLGDIAWFYTLIISMLLIAGVQIVVTILNQINQYKIQGKFAIISNSKFLWHLLRLPMSFFSQRMAGDLANRQKSNENIASILITQLAPLVLSFTTMIIFLVVMIQYSWILTAVGIGFIIINFILARVISEKRVNITRVQMRDFGKLASTTVSGINMIETVKSCGAETGFFQKWAGYQASVSLQDVKYANLNQILGVVPELIRTLSKTIILILSVYLVMQGRFSVGMILAFQSLMFSFEAPATELISVGQQLQELRSDMERTEDVMQYPVDIKFNKDIPLPENAQKLSGDVVMENVTFGYSPLATPLLIDFNLQVKHGQCIAIVGASGSGKSTVSKILSGLYQPWEGRVLFDGNSINEINHSVFTSSVGSVDQDIILFADTIQNNIKMWDKSVEDYEMILAARDAQIHDDIMNRTDGYDYRMLEGGKDFSGGQRQRLEIARVLAQDPTLLILDEATSALDAQTEQEVMTALRNRGVTCIIIAHRLSVVRDCDNIIVLDHGKIVEQGTHEQLIKKNAAYASLITTE